MKPHGEIFAIDLDGTLTLDSCWTTEQVLAATPVEEVVAKVNEVALYHYVCIYTARRDHLIEPSLQWLRMAGIRPHAISNLKMPATFYVDDKNLSIEQFLALEIGVPTTKMV